MIKRYSGQDIFILSTAIVALVFIYTVLIMNEQSTTIKDNEGYNNRMEHSIVIEEDIGKQYLTYSLRNKGEK